MRRRLSLLMFLLFAGPGAFVPMFTVRLQDLGFGPMAMGLACAANALGSMLGPLAAGQVADRWLPMERCLSGCAFLGGVLLWLLASLTSPLAVTLAYLAAWLVLGSTLSLGTALCFAHLQVPERDFGPVRLWGTIGWMAPLWFLGAWYASPGWNLPLAGWTTPDASHADIFRLGALLAFVLAAFSLALPHTPPRREAAERIAPLAALRLLRERSLAILFLCLLGVCVTIPFSSQMTPLLLEQLGVPPGWLPPTLTIAQSVEVLVMPLLSVVLLRLGVRGTLFLGLGSWALALALLTLGRPAWLVIASLSLNGLCICCFVVAGQVYLHGRARGDIRASIQGLLVGTSALGQLLGHLLTGAVRQATSPGREDFTVPFAVAASIALAVTVVFRAGFPADDAASRLQAAPAGRDRSPEHAPEPS